MAKLTIVAHIKAAPDKIELLKSELLKLIEPTRAEDGCIAYTLHQDNDSPEHFLFYETWENRDLWQNHMNTAHIAAYRAASEGAVAEFTIHEMTLTA